MDAKKGILPADPGSEDFSLDEGKKGDAHSEAILTGISQKINEVVLLFICLLCLVIFFCEVTIQISCIFLLDCLFFSYKFVDSF